MIRHESISPARICKPVLRWYLVRPSWSAGSARCNAPFRWIGWGHAQCGSGHHTPDAAISPYQEPSSRYLNPSNFGDGLYRCSSRSFAECYPFPFCSSDPLHECPFSTTAHLRQFAQASTDSHSEGCEGFISPSSIGVWSKLTTPEPMHRIVKVGPICVFSKE